MDLTNEDMKTLSECMNSLKKYGFHKDFLIDEEGLKAHDSDKIYGPDDVRIINYYRFEGESDPGDMSILYAIETFDGYKGVLVDAYGPYASSRVAEFIVEVQEISKKTDRKKDYRKRKNNH